MDVEDFFDLLKQKRFAEVHKLIDSDMNQANQDDMWLINHRRVTVFLSENRHEDALNYLILHRNECGSITQTHETIAMIHEIAGNDDLALAELDSAPFSEEEEKYPLLVADTRFYRLFLRAKRGLPVMQQELDAFPFDYHTYLPANGKMRGIHVTKNDILDLIQHR